MGMFSDLPNIGEVVEKQLLDAGVHSVDELRYLGAEQAWLKIQKIDSSACLHRLLALEGAIRGIKKSEIPQERKDELKEFYQWNKI